ncbi:MAG TPA: hypothetical protein VD999_04720 [Vitreimonas sp.]|nr:hypothetical protein [Vitreimonas sp.]
MINELQAMLRAFFTKQWYYILIAAIVVVAAGLRFYQLGGVPHGMTWDEAAIGYNGYAVISTRRDEWLVKLPVSFKSFGDYKAPLAIYINGFFTYALGMELWVVRLPFALAGVMAVLGMILLVEKIWQDVDEPRARLVSLLAGVGLAFSPWHLHFSRVGFESAMALSFLIWGIYFLMKMVNESKTVLKYLWMMSTAVMLVASIYTYHSAKLVVPLVTALILFWQLRKALKNVVLLGVTGALSTVMLCPLLSDLLWASGSERFHQATLFNKGYEVSQLLSVLIAHFVAHLDPRFLVLGKTDTLRHGDGVWGILLPTTFTLALIGLAFLIFYTLKSTVEKKAHSYKQLLWLGLGWAIIGIVPAMLGVDAPHSNRALLALPGFLLLALGGLVMITEGIKNSQLNKNIQGTHGEKNMVLKAVIGGIVLVHSLFVLSYLQHYYTAFAAQSADDFKDGYLETLRYVIPYEKGLERRPKVDQILFTNKYGQPYIYTLFARRTNPIWYQGGVLNTYLFTDLIRPSDLERPNTLIVAAADDPLPIEKAEKIVYGSDGKVKFKIYYTGSSFLP